MSEKAAEVLNRSRALLNAHKDTEEGERLLKILPQGHGSDLNADMVDGLHAAEILAKSRMYSGGGGGGGDGNATKIQDKDVDITARVDDTILVFKTVSDSYIHETKGAPSAHASTHQNGGEDEVNVAGLSGELANPQPPKAHNQALSTITEHDKAAHDALSIDAATLEGSTKAQVQNHAPQSHATSHQNTGSDEINVAGLSGELADPQPSKSHTHPCSELTDHNKVTHDALNIDADTLDGSDSTDFAPASKGVTNGDSHDHSGGDGAQIDHVNLANKGTNTHAAIDTHLAAAAPHSGHEATANKDQANGYCGLDASALIALARLPRLDLTKIPLGTSAYFLKGQGVSDPIYALLGAGDIPNLDTAKITSGRFIAARLLDGTSGYFLKAQGAGVDPVYALLVAADIPSLDTAKITTGRFIAARLLDGTSGYFLKAQGAGVDPVYAALVAADIPSLDAAKIASGTFGVGRGGTGLSTIALGGILYASALDTLSRIAPTAANQVLRSTAANALQIAALVSADIPWTAIAAILTPDAHNTRDIGVTGTRFKDLYLQGQSNVIRESLFGETADPTLADGLLWHRTDLGKLRGRIKGVTGDLQITPKIATSVVTVSATTTETAFTNLTLTIPASYMQIGKVIRIKAWGVHTSSATPTNPRFRVRFGGVTGTILLDSGVITAIASQTNCLVQIDIIITVISTTTVECQGTIQFNPATAGTPPLRSYAMNSGATVGTTVGNSAVITIATTQNDLVLTCFFSTTTTGNSISIRAGTVEIV